MGYRVGLLAGKCLKKSAVNICKAVRRPGGLHCKSLGVGLRDVRVPDVLLLAIAREMVEAGEVRQGGGMVSFLSAWCFFSPFIVRCSKG